MSKGWVDITDVYWKRTTFTKVAFKIYFHILTNKYEWIGKTEWTSVPRLWLNDKTTTHFAIQKLQGLAKIWEEDLNSIIFTWQDWQDKLYELIFLQTELWPGLGKANSESQWEYTDYEKRMFLNQCDTVGTWYKRNSQKQEAYCHLMLSYHEPKNGSSLVNEMLDAGISDKNESVCKHDYSFVKRMDRIDY